MFTSRAEFRLHLRIDNADRRLTPHGRRLGLIGDEAWAEYERKQARMAALERMLTTTKVDAEALARAGFAELTGTAGLTWAQLLKRPEVTIGAVLAALAKGTGNREQGSGTEGPSEGSGVMDQGAGAAGNAGPSTAAADAAFAQDDSNLNAENDGGIERATRRNEARAVETEIKFAGYLEQQRKAIEKLKAAEGVAIPEWMEYSAISGLSREMREILERVRPVTIGQASRLPGVTPAALSLVHVSIRLQGARRKLAS